MKTKREVHNLICQALGRQMDPVLGPLGFMRVLNSVEYVRNVADGTQQVCLFSENRPHCEPLAWARLHPQIRLIFPEVNRIACELVGGQTGLIGSGDLTFSQPFDLVVPKQYFTRWFIYDEPSIDSCMRSVWASLQTWIIPFLNEYSSIKSLTVAYENKDQRFVWSRPLCMFIIAAFIHCNNLNMASDVLETKFGSPGVRKQYAMAFDYVSNLNAKSK